MSDELIEGVPQHVAVIMDGNGRWAKARGWPRILGHRAGVRRTKEIVKSCPDFGVKYITLYAFSTENWKRNKREIKGLMSLFRGNIRREGAELHKEGVRMVFIGDRSPLDDKLQALMAEIEDLTRDNTRLTLAVALNYGGRDEVMRAVRALAAQVQAGAVAPEALDEAALEAHLDTAGLPDPDLVIRTSGECRTSNFLMWQSAYAEFEFTDTLWPDFSRDEFAKILSGFADRDRRFGGAKA